MAVSDFYTAFSFTPNGQATLLLNGVLEAVDDELRSRLASFEYLKRDGAEIEPLGAAQAHFSFRVVLMGSAPLTPGGASLSAGERYQKLVTAQRGQPRGLLTHPRLGRWQVGWAQIRAHEQPQRAVDTLELTLDFIEDQLDQALAVEQRPTPQARGGEVTTAYSVLVAAVALRFGNSPDPLLQAVVSSTDRLATVAAGFVTAALIAAQSAVPDQALAQQLGGVEAATNVLQAALLASLTQTLEPEVSLTPYRHQAYMTLAGCVQMIEAIAEQQPVLTIYEVPTAMSLDQVLVAIYGNQARSHFTEAFALNRIPNPLWIPQGTRLRVIAPQILQ